MSLYEYSVPTFVQMLENLSSWLDKAQAHADAKKFDSAVYLSARLAPDQFPFVRQVQSSCDNAKLAIARLTGKEAPKHADDETTLAQLKARVASTLEWVRAAKPEDFQGAAERKLQFPWAPGKFVWGKDLLRQHALPNFYFHLTHTYAILRHNGVDLGKRDYLQGLQMHDLA
jgi:hypothetical protein